MSLFGAQQDRAQSSADGLIYLSQSQLIALRAAGESLSLRQNRITSQQSGAYLSRFKGRGMEFDEARQYQPGDDVRILDWRVTARTGIPHTKLFREERERPVLTWVDLRPSMFFATQGTFKSVVAAKAAALVTWSANKQGDRLGGMVFNADEHHELRPQRGKAATLQWLKQLSQACQWQPDNNTEIQDAGAALARLRRVAKPGSLIFLFSDFRQMGNQAESHIAQLSRHNDIVLFNIFDPMERELPQNGQYNVCWQQRFSSFDSNEKNRRQYQQQFQQHLEQVERLGRFPGVHIAHCATNDDVLQKLIYALGAKRS